MPLRDDGSTPTYQKQIYDESIEQKNVDSIRLKVLADVSQENTPSMLNSPLESREGIFLDSEFNISNQKSIICTLIISFSVVLLYLCYF